MLPVEQLAQSSAPSLCAQEVCSRALRSSNPSQILPFLLGLHDGADTMLHAFKLVHDHALRKGLLYAKGIR